MEFNYNLIAVSVNEEAIEAYIESDLCGSEFLITDEEGRKKKAREEIQESLWAFNTSFILDHSSKAQDLSFREQEELKKAISNLQGELCESANSIVKMFIDDLDQFIEDAISADGYGHFLAGYDHEEIEYTDEDGNELFIYRQN